jgi:hypothetical protein
MLWALANLNHIPGTPLLEACGNALLANLALCAPKQAAQAMWGFARMEYRPPNQLLDAVLKVCCGGGGGACVWPGRGRAMAAAA